MTTINNNESGLSVRNKLNDIWAGLELNAIDTSIAATAVDVFVYDTSKDSDGGAWRKRTQGTSWYNETLNTATRGSRREFPAVAVIVAESDKVTIYDGDDPALPMWMVFNTGGSGSNFNFIVTGLLTGCVFRDGKLCLSSGGNGLIEISFLEDRAKARYAAGMFFWAVGIALRNSTPARLGGTDAANAIVNSTANDVAMTVLPAAPIDPATGLPVPTIAVATAGGVSVITDSGAVYDSGTTINVAEVGFNEIGDLLFTRNGWTASLSYSSVADYEAGDGFGDQVSATTGTHIPALQVNGFPGVEYFGSAAAIGGNGALSGHTAVAGLQLQTLPTSDFTKGMSALLTSTYNTGWMNGDIKGAFLSDTDDTDLVGGTDADRSVNANPLTVNGTVTRTAVATGADLVAYSGFSASNYLEQPYNSDLDFGTGDFCVMGWVNSTSVLTEYIFDLNDASDVGPKIRAITSGGNFVSRVGASSVTHSARPAGWGHFCLERTSGLVSFYINGKLDGSRAVSDDLSNASAVLTVGVNYALASQWSGSLALLRISATAPTAEQVRKIYEDEKFLFQDNAQATLFGASDAVTALAHDPVTDLLHVGTSAGRSVFQGLRRVSNTTTAVGTAISAQAGLVAEE